MGCICQLLADFVHGRSPASGKQKPRQVVDLAGLNLAHPTRFERVTFAFAV